MSNKNYYETLGVARDASQEDIKKAFKRLSMKHHPDRNPDQNSSKKFQEISEAYNTLSDPAKRKNYDKYGTNDPYAGRGGNPFDQQQADDIFADLFGQARTTRPSRGDDISTSIELTLEEAALGVTKILNLYTFQECVGCNGAGGENPRTCATCRGTGTVKAQLVGIFTVERTCSDCGGEGVNFQKKCYMCLGEGITKQSSKVSVDIPMGLDTGSVIRMSGQGHAGRRGTKKGDLNLHIKIKAHPVFQRKKADLFCQVPVSFTTAVLGGTIMVQDLHAQEEELNIPAGTRTNTEFRIKNRGMPIYNSSRKGDLICTVVIETPTNITEEQKKILLDLSETMGDKPMQKTEKKKNGSRK